MTASILEAPTDRGREPGARRRRRGRRAWALVVAAVLAAAIVVDRTNPDGISFAHPLGHSRPAPAASIDNSAATSTAAIVRRTLAARTLLNGTLGYAGTYDVIAQAHGTITWLPAAGDVIRQGQVLFRVDGAPVLLMYGTTPAYRTLMEGARAADVAGADVAQLNHDLVALGYGRDVRLDASSDRFGWDTRAAIKELQRALGVRPTGELDLGQVVFVPTALRITRLSGTLGGPAGGSLLKATSTTHEVTVDLDAAEQSELKAGDHVAITLPNGRSTPGVVVSVGSVASTPEPGSNAASTVPVVIAPTDAAAAGTLDQAPVQVAITTSTARDVLAVPVTALLALAGGGYAVEVVGAGAVRHLTSVRLGLFDDADGLVQVTGRVLAAGVRVVVPAS